MTVAYCRHRGGLLTAAHMGQTAMACCLRTSEGGAAVAVVPHAAVVVAGRLLRAAAVLRRLGVAAVPRRLHDGPEGRRLQLSQYVSR